MQKARVRRVELHGNDYCIDEVIIHENLEIVLAKRVDDAARIPRSIGEEMKSLSDFFEAVPIISAERIWGERLEEGVVYARHRIAVVSRRTFEELLRGTSEEPLIYVDRGGVYVKVRGEILRRKREERGLSRSDVANELRVTPRMVTMYEENLSDATLEVAERLERLFGSEVFEKLSLRAIKEVFEGRAAVRLSHPRSEFIAQVLSNLGRHGYIGYSFHRAPIDAGAKKGSEEPRIAIKEWSEEDERELSLAKEVSRETGTKLVVVSERAGNGYYSENFLIVPRASASEVARRILSCFSQST